MSIGKHLKRRKVPYDYDCYTNREANNPVCDCRFQVWEPNIIRTHLILVTSRQVENVVYQPVLIFVTWDLITEIK